MLLNIVDIWLKPYSHCIRVMGLSSQCAFHLTGCTSFDHNRSFGNCCGLVCRAVASDTKGPRFKSSHPQNFIVNIFTFNCWKYKNNEKRDREWPIWNKTGPFVTFVGLPSFSYIRYVQTNFILNLRLLQSL